MILLAVRFEAYIVDVCFHLGASAYGFSNDGTTTSDAQDLVHQLLEKSLALAIAKGHNLPLEHPLLRDDACQ